MAIETECMTPGTTFKITTHPDMIDVMIKFPAPLALTEGQATHLENTIHNALELALAPLFVGPEITQTEKIARVLDGY